ncbi:MAG: hypothetical protein IKT93_01120 [Clostridia bacterium]|nr:hypothetical protein [Clostridia bacterium]
MKVLVACEESQRVCLAFRDKGHEAYSCDIIECSGGHPEYHIQEDVIKLVGGGENNHFITLDGTLHFVEKWDLIIAHPPCTYLSLAGNSWFNVERYGEKAIQRHKDREEAVKFFMYFTTINCPRIAIENPIGTMSTRYKKPTQIIQPYQFGHAERKPTCLWLKGLPLLKPTNIVEPDIIYHKSGRTDSRWHWETFKLPKNERAKIRSKTFEGIAKAMAEQWG